MKIRAAVVRRTRGNRAGYKRNCGDQQQYTSQDIALNGYRSAGR